MSLTVFEGLQSEIYVPITPKSIFTPVTKPLSEMVIALASACGAHLKTDKGTAPTHFGFMGGGGDQTAFHDKTGPAIAQKLKDENVDGVILTAG